MRDLFIGNVVRPNHRKREPETKKPQPVDVDASAKGGRSAHLKARAKKVPITLPSIDLKEHRS